MDALNDKERRSLTSLSRSECPFIHSFVSGCYCTELKSVKVEEAIYYCGANYGKCNIYKRLKKMHNVQLPVSGDVQLEKAWL